MNIRYVDTNHVRGPGDPEALWLAANDLDISLVPVNQLVEIHPSRNNDVGTLSVYSFVKDATGLRVIAGSGYLRVPVEVRLQTPPEEFGVTPIEDPRGA